MPTVNQAPVTLMPQENPEYICIRHKYLQQGESFVMTDNEHKQHVASKDDNDGIIEVPFVFGKGLTGRRESIWEVVEKPENLVVVEVDSSDTYSILGKPKMTVSDVEYFIGKNVGWFDEFVTKHLAGKGMVAVPIPPVTVYEPPADEGIEDKPEPPADEPVKGKKAK